MVIFQISDLKKKRKKITPFFVRSIIVIFILISNHTNIYSYREKKKKQSNSARPRSIFKTMFYSLIFALLLAIAMAQNCPGTHPNVITNGNIMGAKCTGQDNGDAHDLYNGMDSGSCGRASQGEPATRLCYDTSTVCTFQFKQFYEFTA
jgi:hypothetical protein